MYITLVWPFFWISWGNKWIGKWVLISLCSWPNLFWISFNPGQMCSKYGNLHSIMAFSSTIGIIENRWVHKWQMQWHPSKIRDVWFMKCFKYLPYYWNSKNPTYYKPIFCLFFNSSQIYFCWNISSSINLLFLTSMMTKYN